MLIQILFFKFHNPFDFLLTSMILAGPGSVTGSRHSFLNSLHKRAKKKTCSFQIAFKWIKLVTS
jgi:hypothetical protein